MPNSESNGHSPSVADMPAGALYLYCLTDQEPAGMRSIGIGGRGRVVSVGVGNLWAVVQDIEPEDWTGDRGEANMSELSWVGPRAVHHEDVIERAMELATVFPLPFGTIFSSAEALSAHLEQRGDEIREFLGRVAGSEEWSVKGVVDRTIATQFLAQQTRGPQSGSPGSGAAYLRQRKRQQTLHAEVAPMLEDLASQLLDQLSSVTRAQCVLKPRAHAATELVFHWAFLVEHGTFDSLKRIVDRFNTENRRKGLELMVSGPWPAYSFRETDVGA